MEIKILKPTVEVTLEMEDGSNLVFLTQHVSDAQFQLDYIDKQRRSERCLAVISDAVVGWNLDHDDGTPWECLPEVRPKLLVELAAKKVKRLVGPDGKDVPKYAGLMLGLALFSFVRDQSNYLKN